MKKAFPILLMLLSILFVFILFLPDFLNDSTYQQEASSTESLIPPSSSPSNTSSEELRACWFSYLEWQQLLCNKDEETYKALVNQICENLQKAGFNTLMLHVRAFGDAMYPSEFFPSSKNVTGSIGTEMTYDPLSIFITEASAHEIQIHAWINPLRTMTDAEWSQVSDRYLIKQWYTSSDRNDYYVKDQSGKYILNPENPEVRTLVCNGVSELLTKYPLAGVHIDDYFYPVGIENLEENDVNYYNKVQPSTDIDQWRRNSTSALVHQIYQTVHHTQQQAVFGVSPQANLENNYYKLYIDVEKWLKEPEYVDYIMPQLYFGFENSSKPFDRTASQWNEMIQQNVKLYAGLAAYKIGVENDANAGKGNEEWKQISQTSQDILKRQEDYLRTLSHYEGYCLYSYQSLFLSDGSSNPKTWAEIEHLNQLF